MRNLRLKLNRAVAISAILLWTAQSQALTLDEALKVGADNSPELKAAQASVSEYDWKKRDVLGNYLPKFNATLLHTFDAQYQALTVPGLGSVPFVSPSTLLDGAATWNIFDGLCTTYSYKAASRQQEAAEFTYENTKMKVENLIKTKFYQALGAKVLADSAADNVATLNDHLVRAKNLLREGELTRVDLLKIQVQVDRAVPEKESADDNLYLAKKDLAQAMGLESTADLDIKGDLPVPDAKILEAAKNVNIETRLDYQATIKQTQAADDLHKAAESIWYPKVSFFGDWQTYNNINESFNNGPFKYAYTLGIQATWNLFDGGSSWAKQNEAFYKKVQAEQGLRKAVLAAPNELDFWRRKYKYNTVLYTANVHQIEASEESVKIFKTQLLDGTVTNSDLLDAELELDRARVGLVRSQLDAVEAMLNIELSVGRRIQ